MDTSKNYEVNIYIDSNVRKMLEALGWHIDEEDCFESDLYAPERSMSYYLCITHKLKSRKYFFLMIESKEDFENICDEGDCLEYIFNYIEWSHAYEPFTDWNHDGKLEAEKREFDDDGDLSEADMKEANTAMKNLVSAISLRLNMDWDELQELKKNRGQSYVQNYHCA